MFWKHCKNWELPGQARWSVLICPSLSCWSVAVPVRLFRRFPKNHNFWFGTMSLWWSHLSTFWLILIWNTCMIIKEYWRKNWSHDIWYWSGFHFLSLRKFWSVHLCVSWNMIWSKMTKHFYGASLNISPFGSGCGFTLSIKLKINDLNKDVII